MDAVVLFCILFFLAWTGGVMFGRTIFAKRTKSIGTLKIAVDTVDNEPYIALEMQESILTTVKNGETVTMDVKIVRK